MIQKNRVKLQSKNAGEYAHSAKTISETGLAFLNLRPAFRIQPSVSLSVKPVNTFIVDLLRWVPRPRLHLGLEMLEGSTDLNPASVSPFQEELSKNLLFKKSNQSGHLESRQPGGLQPSMQLFCKDLLRVRTRVRKGNGGSTSLSVVTVTGQLG